MLVGRFEMMLSNELAVNDDRKIEILSNYSNKKKQVWEEEGKKQ